MIGKWSTKNAMVMESCEDFVTLFEFWAEQCVCVRGAPCSRDLS